MPGSCSPAHAGASPNELAHVSGASGVSSLERKRAGFAKYKREVQGMEISFLENWTLAPDGKVLTIVNNLSTPQGDFALKMVLEKQ